MWRSTLKVVVVVVAMDSIAIVGLGNISNKHRANLKKLYPNAVIYAVSSSGRAVNNGIENADFCLSSLQEAIDLKVNFAIIASPATYHLVHAIGFINSGIPVLIEKPLAATACEALMICEAAERTGVPVAVAYCLRYLSSAQFLYSLIKQRTIGHIYNVFAEVGQYLPTWRPNKDYRESVSARSDLGGGALLELSHEFDYLYWIFGDMKPHMSILRSSKELGLCVEDTVDVMATNSTNAVFSIHLDFLQKSAHRKCRIVGSDGVLEWDIIKNKILLIRENNEELIFDGSGQNRNQMYLSMLADFDNKIQKKANQCITLQEAFKTLTFIEQVKDVALKA